MTYIFPPGSAQRFFVFEDGVRSRMYPIRESVRTSRDLELLAARKKPSGIYCSRGRWVDAPNMPGKKRRINIHPFLGGDVVFDIEPGGDPLGMARRCFRAGKERYSGAAAFGNATGSGGYHIWFLDIFPRFFPGPLALRTSDREAQFGAFLRGEDRHFRSLGLDFCGNSFADTTHIFRVTGSSHSGTGKPVVRLPEFTLVSGTSLAGQAATNLCIGTDDEADDAQRKSPGDGVEAGMNLLHPAGRTGASAPGDRRVSL